MLGPWEITLSQDGDKWCALMGENLQTGLAGFGHSPDKALHSLARAIRTFDRWKDLEKFGKEGKC